MPCICAGERSCGYLQNPHPYGYKHINGVVGAQLIVHFLQNILWLFAGLRAVFQQHLCDYHKERCRDALSGNIGNYQSQMIVIHQEEIIEIAANLFRRGHCGIDIELRSIGEGREDAGQHAGLNSGGNRQLGTDAFFFRGDFCEILDVIVDALLHLTYRMVKPPHFVAGAAFRHLKNFLFRRNQPRLLLLHKAVGNAGQTVERANQGKLCKQHRNHGQQNRNNQQNRDQSEKEAVFGIFRVLHGKNNCHVAPGFSTVVPNCRHGIGGAAALTFLPNGWNVFAV